jgi:hypothetical protein
MHKDIDDLLSWMPKTFLTPFQVDNLHHTAAPISGFSKDHSDRFEILDSNVEGVDSLPWDAEDADFYWYDTQLEWFFAFNYFCQQTPDRLDVFLLNDMEEGISCYCLCTKLREEE